MYEKTATRPLNRDSNTFKSNSTKIKSRSRFIQYFINHYDALTATIHSLRAEMLSTLFTCLVIAIAFALPVSLLILLSNAHALIANWTDNNQITLYLHSQITSERAQHLKHELETRHSIHKIKFISSTDGLKTFEKQMGFHEAINLLSDNPLPDVFIIFPSEHFQRPEALENLKNQLSHLPEVSEASFNVTWVKRLYAILALAKHFTISLALLLGIGVMFIVGNTIHLATQNQRRNIEVYRLVGASRAYIMRPFLYTGFLYGMGGALLAVLIVNMIIWWLQTPAEELALLYHSDFALHTLSGTQVILQLFVGAMLGLLGAWMSCRKDC